MKITVDMKFKDKEIEELLKSMVILVDTREQENSHILNYFDKKKIKYIKQKLDVGDYAFMLPGNKLLGIDKDIYFNNQIVVERKGSLDELASNVTKERTRIVDEFLRAKDTSILLMIENAKYSDVVAHNYRSQLNEKAFLGTIKSFESKFNISTNFIDDKIYSGNFIYHSFYYRLRNYLKG